MENEQAGKTNTPIDPYLESPKTFHLEMPLYHKFDLKVEKIIVRTFELMSFSETIDAYCIWCDKESVFETDEYYRNVLPYWKEADSFLRIVFTCSRDQSHRYYIYYLKGESALTKIGQWPSAADFQIPQAEKYRKILGEEEYKELTKGIGLAAHGVGIGSFVYLRRVFENLIEDAHQMAKKEDKGFNDDEFGKARMDDKIKMVSDYLPDFLVKNRVLYKILSTGIHDLDEGECIKHFEVVKIGIEQILDEKIVQKEKTEKAAQAHDAIQKTHGFLTGSR